MANKIQMLRGNKASLPVLSAGEIGYSTDTKELYIGNPTGGNTQIPTINTPISGMMRQAIINGNFDIWQRGTSVTNPVLGYFSADRFLISYSADGGVLPTSLIHSRLSLSNDEVSGAGAAYRITANGSGTFGANASYGLYQRIENGTRFLCGVGKKITISFYTKSSIANKKLGIAFSQRYGSGGSVSAVETIKGKVIALTSSWTKHTITVDTNTLAGKVFGTNNDDYFQIGFLPAWGANTASSQLEGSTAESFGGSGTIDIAQVQVNAGDTALPYQPRSFAEELALCQRYFQLIKAQYFRSPPSSFTTATETGIIIKLSQNMRVSPTVTIGGTRGTDWQLFNSAGIPNNTGILTQFNYGTDYAVVYFTGGTFLEGAIMGVTLMTTIGEYRFDAEL